MRHKKWNNNKIKRATWFSCHLRLSRRLDWLWKIMAKKREEAEGDWEAPEAAIVAMLWFCASGGKLEIIWARHISRTRTFIINSFGIPDFHFLFLYFRAHYTTLLFLFNTTFLYFRSILVRRSSLERERERRTLARNYGQNNILELPLISARGLRVNSLRKINKSVCKALWTVPYRSDW